VPEKVLFTVFILAPYLSTGLVINQGFVSRASPYKEIHQRTMVAVIIRDIVLLFLSPPKDNVASERHPRPKSR